MSKSVASALLTDIQRGVQTLAVLIQITRDDGTVYRHTNHDTTITFQDKVYDHTVPFILSAIPSGSALAVDTTELELQIDETIFLDAEFRAGAFENAQIEIFQVDFNTPDNGRIIMRKGWFGKIERNKNRVAKIEVTGLLKILDFQVGRIYQPACDADLGDSRCRVAVDLAQARSYLSFYGAGDFVYWYDTSAMNDLGIVNGDFQDNGGDVPPATAIVGWTKSPSSQWHVRAASVLGVPAEPSGGRLIEGTVDADPAGEEHYIFQDIDLVAAGVNATEIDDGQVILAFFVGVAQSLYLLDKPRILIECMDSTGALVETKDTGYFTLDFPDVWREKSQVFNLLPTVRTVRLYLYGLRADADILNIAYGNIRGYHWNHLTEFPFNDVIHKVARVRGGVTEITYRPALNGSFEVDGAVANSSAADITSWTKGSGDFWRVTTTLAGETPTAGTYFLVGGDDASGVQQSYVISQSYNLAGSGGLDVARIALGKIAGTFSAAVSWGDVLGSSAGITIEFYNALNVLVGTYDHLALTTSATVTTVEDQSSFTIPATARSIKMILTARSPVGSSAANVAFDDLKFSFSDYERPTTADPIKSRGDIATVPNYTVGSVTIDGGLIWKASSYHHQFDEVATVTDRKIFTGTNITGVDGSFETSFIRWISGDNAGSRNLIRKWVSADKEIKLYFPTVNPIQIGDRFIYVKACQKDFLADCIARFDNALNFQGFPHLPSKLD